MPEFNKPSLREMFQATKFSKRKAYESIPSADSLNGDGESIPDGSLPDEKGQHGSSNQGWFRAMAYFLFGFLFATVLAVVVLWTQAAAQSRGNGNAYTPPDPRAFPELYFSDEFDPPPMLNHSCGSTPAEARAAGCVFDLLTTAWTPPECVDLELTREWLDVVTKEGQKWPYYHDEDGKEPQKDLSYLQSGEWDGELWSTLGLHQYHCLFIWRKMHLAYLAGNAVDTVMRGLKHSKHCERMMMLNADPSKISGVQAVYYRAC